MSKLRLVFLALGIGVLMVLLTRLGSSATTGAPFAIQPQLDLLQVVMVSIPFLVLAMGGIRARLPWLVGLALTVALWIYVMSKAGSAGPRPAPDEGLALFLLASPLLISFACIAAFVLTQRSRGTAP